MLFLQPISESWRVHGDLAPKQDFAAVRGQQVSLDRN
jgi:hypothetical protein